jgi:cobalt-zinc-cadmium efflux system protein
MAHHHQHPHSSQPLKRLGAVLALIAVYAVAEAVGGLWSQSLALLADAGHMFTDVMALLLAVFAGWSATRPPDPSRTYGYQRAEILAALFNGVALIGMAVFICVEAWQRLHEPRTVEVGLMALVATGGLIVNIICARMLHGHSQSMNVRAAYLHILGDLLGSVGALIAAAAIGLGGIQWADPVASIVIAGIIVFSAIRLVLDSVHVLMEGAPLNMDSRDVQDCLRQLPGVCEVHDLHLWSLGGYRPILSAHLVLDHTETAATVLRTAVATLKERFEIDHATLQVEPPDFNIQIGSA